MKMIKYLLLIPLVFLASCNSCTNKESEKIIGNKPQKVDSVITANPEINPNNTEEPCKGCGCFKNKTAVWAIETDDKGQDYLVRGDSLDYVNKYPYKIIDAMNKIYTVKAKIMEIKDYTIHVAILNDTYFTQQIGAMGANSYMAALVFSLTDSKQYKNVNFIFEEGDHAVPGKYNRNTFESKTVTFRTQTGETKRKEYIVCPHRIQRD